jgi:hypothetical protein
LIALMTLGCARNAFLELEIELPKNERAEERHAVIRVVTETPFDIEWQGDNPIPPVKLSTTGVTSQRVSIEGTSDSETKPVRVKVRFCKQPNCTDLQDDRAPEAWLEIERAFYIGKRTSLKWTIACVPNVVDVTPAPPTCAAPNKTVVPIEKCKVSGCRGGAPTSNNCVAGKHFCEE